MPLGGGPISVETVSGRFDEPVVVTTPQGWVQGFSRAPKKLRAIAMVAAAGIIIPLFPPPAPAQPVRGWTNPRTNDALYAKRTVHYQSWSWPVSYPAQVTPTGWQSQTNKARVRRAPPNTDPSPFVPFTPVVVVNNYGWQAIYFEGAPIKLRSLGNQWSSFVPLNTLQANTSPPGWVQPLSDARLSAHNIYYQSWASPVSYPAPEELAFVEGWEPQTNEPRPSLRSLAREWSSFVPFNTFQPNTQTPDKWLQPFQGPPKLTLPLPGGPILTAQVVLYENNQPTGWWQPLGIAAKATRSVSSQWYTFVPLNTAQLNTVTPDNWMQAFQGPPRLTLTLPGGPVYTTQVVLVENNVPYGWYAPLSTVPASTRSISDSFSTFFYFQPSILTIEPTWLTHWPTAPHRQSITPKSNLTWVGQFIPVFNTVTVDKYLQPLGKAYRPTKNYAAKTQPILSWKPITTTEIVWISTENPDTAVFVLTFCQPEWVTEDPEDNTWVVETEATADWTTEVDTTQNWTTEDPEETDWTEEDDEEQEWTPEVPTC